MVQYSTVSLSSVCSTATVCIILPNLDSTINSLSLQYKGLNLALHSLFFDTFCLASTGNVKFWQKGNHLCHRGPVAVLDLSLKRFEWNRGARKILPTPVWYNDCRMTMPVASLFSMSHVHSTYHTYMYVYTYMYVPWTPTVWYSTEVNHSSATTTERFQWKPTFSLWVRFLAGGRTKFAQWEKKWIRKIAILVSACIVDCYDRFRTMRSRILPWQDVYLADQNAATNVSPSSQCEDGDTLVAACMSCFSDIYSSFQALYLYSPLSLYQLLS